MEVGDLEDREIQHKFDRFKSTGETIVFDEEKSVEEKHSDDPYYNYTIRQQQQQQ